MLFWYYYYSCFISFCCFLLLLLFLLSLSLRNGKWRNGTNWKRETHQRQIEIKWRKKERKKEIIKKRAESQRFFFLIRFWCVRVVALVWTSPGRLEASPPQPLVCPTDSVAQSAIFNQINSQMQPLYRPKNRTHRHRGSFSATLDTTVDITQHDHELGLKFLTCQTRFFFRFWKTDFCVHAAGGVPFRNVFFGFVLIFFQNINWPMCGFRSKSEKSEWGEMQHD